MHIVKRLLKCVKDFKKNAILAPTFVALEVVVDTLIPYVMMYLLGCFPLDGTAIDINKVIMYGVILVALAFLALLFGALSGVQASYASAGLGRNIRSEMFEKIQDYSFENIDKFSNASLITRMTTDVMYVMNAFMMLIRMAVRSPLVLIFGVVASAIIGGPIAAIYVVVVPVMTCCIILLFTRASKHFKKLFKKIDKMNNVVEENIRGMRVVKSNNQEEFEKQKFTKSADDIMNTFTKAQRIMVMGMPIMQIFMYATIVLIFHFGSHKIIETNAVGLSQNQLSSLITYATQILMSLMMLSMLFVQLVIAKSSAERICEVLEEQPKIVSKENAEKVVPDGSIDYENVTFKYSESAAIDSLSNINLHIRSGEVIGILGSTGSAKTTLVQLIPRLYDVTTGELKVGGKNVKDYDIKALRSSVAMVLQKNVLFSGTVRQNLLWGKEDATEEEIANALKISASDEFVERIGGLEAKIEQGGANLSGGQRQRLCIARAILAKPKILILDDSTSAVDMNTDKRIRKAFSEFMPDTTKIIIAQRIASVIDADRILVMDDGKISGIGTHDELMNVNEIYTEIYNSQNMEGGDFDAEN